MSADDRATFPRLDVVGPNVDGTIVPGLDVVADVVAPGATAADAVGVPRGTLDALAAAGLLGTALEPAAQRELAELLAGSDASTWFCWSQHQTPLRALEASVPSPDAPAVDALRSRLLPGLRSGRLLAAVAFAHVRRPGPPNPVATRVPGGWRLDGSLDWVTSWDIADVVMVIAQGAGDDAGSLLTCYLPAGRAPEPAPGMVAGPPLRLLAMSGTHTRPVTLDGVVVPMSEVGALHERRAWLEQDAARTVDASPAAFGVARGAVAELHDLGVRRSDDPILDLAAGLAADCRRIRARAYSLADAPDAAAHVDDRLRLRAAALDLVARAATSVVVARAGASMRSGCSAERRLRESMFLQVQAQTAATRRASLERLAAASPQRGG